MKRDTMKTAFITSTGRTGTDFFTTLFNDYVENAWSLHEPKPAFRRRSHQLIGRGHNLFEKYYFKQPRIKRHNRQTELWYVETNYHLATCIPFLRAVFPESIVIHVIRDGREVVTSWLNKFRYITNDHLLPQHVGDREAETKWDSWNPVQKLGWYWKTTNNLACEYNPDLWIRFEDIFSGNKEGVYRVLDQFSDIHYHPQSIDKLLSTKVNSTKARFFPNYEEWPHLWRTQFWEIAGDAMQKFGYEDLEGNSGNNT